MMDKILNLDIATIPDNIIKQEIQRISSEYNLRTYNMRNNYFY
jgi:hypothetical protein